MNRFLRAELVSLKVTVNNITVIAAAGKHHTSDTQSMLSSKGLVCNLSMQANVEVNEEQESRDDFLNSLKHNHAFPTPRCPHFLPSQTSRPCVQSMRSPLSHPQVGINTLDL